MSLRRAFTTGLITQLSNPKIAIVLASIFTALLPKEIPTHFILFYPSCVFIDAGWCSLVAVALSAEKPRRVYLKFKAIFDRSRSSDDRIRFEADFWDEVIILISSAYRYKKPLLLGLF